MPTTEQLICPKCQGKLAAVFTGKHSPERSFVCPKCDQPDPLATEETQGWIKSGLQPPK